MNVTNTTQSREAMAFSPQVAAIVPENSIEEIVSWLRSDETPLVYKIGAIALPVILSYALGALLGYPFLTATFVGLTIGIVAYTALGTLNGRELFAQETATSLTLIKNAIGGEEAFQALPELDLSNRTWQLLDFLRPGNLSHSVMKGVERSGMPCISLKLRANSPNAPQEPFIVTFFLLPPHGAWCYATQTIRIEDAEGNPLFNDRLRAEDFTAIHQIVVERNHPILSLV